MLPACNSGYESAHQTPDFEGQQSPGNVSLAALQPGHKGYSHDEVQTDGARGAHMRALIRMLAAAVALAMSAGAALAVLGKTNTDVALRTAPSARAELIHSLPEGTLVNVGRCSHSWCGVSWNKFGGHARASALQFQSTPAAGPPAIPVFPTYPYKAGHYPTADAYYDLPPYAATDPSFYPRRHFLTAQERNRYRYMPHIFRGPSGYLEHWPSVSSSETPEPASEPVSPKSPPKTEPSPAGPAGVLEPKVKEEDTAPSPSAPDRPPGAPEPSPPAPEAPLGTPAPRKMTRCTRIQPPSTRSTTPCSVHQRPKNHSVHQNRAPKPQRHRKDQSASPAPNCAT